MKTRLVLFIFCMFAIAFIAYKMLGVSQELSSPPATPIPTKTPKEADFTLNYRDIVYDYAFFFVHDFRTLRLIPNFETQSRSSTLVSKNKCAQAINGGFYTKDSKPLGAFVSTAYQQPKKLTSSLFNGFFGFTDTQATITQDLDPTYTSILQSGPLLLSDTTPLPLTIQNDEHARRSVVATTVDGRVLFVTFYIHDSIYNGPLLEDLPFVLKQFAFDQDIAIQTALNLDGGSATYFKNSETELPELTPIGSMICVQN